MIYPQITIYKNVYRFQAHEAQRLQAQQKEAMRILAEQKIVAQQQKILQQQPFVQDTSSVNSFLIF